MTSAELQTLAQVLTGRMLNTAAEGMILAALLWALLRLIRRQNSGTRFAIWFAALLTIVALPFLAGSGVDRSHSPMIASAKVHREIILSASWAFYLFLGWASVASFLLLRLIVGPWQVHRLRGNCRHVKLESLEPAIAAIVRDFRLRSEVKVLVSKQVNVPAAIGFIRPAIVFPAWLLPQLSAAEVEVILLHEHAHLRRWDQWTNLAQKFVKALFFFHPAVWWIESRLTLEREMACDDTVLAESASPGAYASLLVSFAEKVQNARALALVQTLMSRTRQLSLRVAQILDAKRPIGTGRWMPAVGVGAGLLAIMVGAASHLPQVVGFQDDVAFQNHAGFQNESSRVQALHVQAPQQTPTQERRAAVMASTSDSSQIVAPMVARRLTAAQPPRAIPAAYHSHAAAVPLRPKATTASRPAVVRTVARDVTPDGTRNATRTVTRKMVRTNAALTDAGQETFVILQTTQYDSSGSGVWTLCIWTVDQGKSNAREMESSIAPKI